MKCVLKEIFCNDKKGKDAIIAGVAIIVLIAAFTLAANRIFGRGGKICSVDMEVIMGEHPAMHEAMNEFQKELTAMQKQLDALEGEAKEQEQMKMQQQIQEIAMRMQEGAMGRIMRDIEQIAKKRGYSYVIEKNALITGGRDITEAVVSAIKEKEKEVQEEDTEVMPMIPLK